MPDDRRTNSILSTTGTLSPTVSKIRPRFFVLMILFVGLSTITVALLGWQLTLISARSNIRGLIAEMEDLISHQIFGIIQDAADSLQELTHLQATYFRQNKWSQSTPERRNETLRSMLTLINRHRKQSADIYYYTYPEGLMFGYVFPNDDLSIAPQMITQDSSTLFMKFFNVNELGDPVGPSFFSFPGSNITNSLLPGGSFNANIDYSNKTWKGFTGIFVASTVLLKSCLQIAVNPFTGEQVTVGNDWTMNLVSSRLSEIVSNVPYPTFAAFLDIAGGHLVATSVADLSLVAPDQVSIVPLESVNNSFAQDFSSYLRSAFPSKTVKEQLRLVADLIKVSKQQDKIYVDRTINATRWMLQLKVMDLLGERFVFAVYMNMDYVERDVISSGEKTGYMMLGIILGVLALGTLFAWTVASQLTLVSRQIALLKQLKFHQVLDKNSGIKGRSFIYELAGLQEAFYEMAQTFGKTLELQSSLQQRGKSSNTDKV
ncbi:hypothetical protein BDR26DRAFT_865484 [Obelidium mucronatum]|nr:hypothetical protein BDR26DRAFT_865484 [Obelidium mucronatum]